MNKILHLAILICFISSATWSLAAPAAGGPELRRELQAYASDNIMPVLKEQRLNLEAQLSAPDKRQLEQLRLRLRHLRAEQQELRKALRAEQNNSRAPLTDEQKARLRAQQQKREQVFTAVRAIAARYRPQLQRIQAQLADNRLTWETDIRKIIDSHTTDLNYGRRHRRLQQAGRGMQYRQLMRPVHFLLWKVEAAPGEIAENLVSSVFPNPSTSSHTIAYNVAQAGQVQITLLNHQGASIRNVLHEHKDTGSYRLQVRLDNLPNGLYYYKIESAAGVETIRFLKN